jgi:hypothetical protein
MTQYPPSSAIVVERMGAALNYELPRATTTGRVRLPKLFNVSVPDLKSPLKPEMVCEIKKCRILSARSKKGAVTV